jgi:hypothetical protein
MNLSDLSPSQLRQAATIKERIAKLQKELYSILGTTTASATAPDGPKQKRTVSAATRAKMAAAQQKRRAAQQPATVAPKSKAKGKMNPATKALLSAKLKAYWAKRRAAKKK